GRLPPEGCPALRVRGVWGTLRGSPIVDEASRRGLLRTGNRELRVPQAEASGPELPMPRCGMIAGAYGGHVCWLGMTSPGDIGRGGAPIPAGAVLVGKYRIERVLGEGGMGVVYAVHHILLDRPVALKLLARDAAGNPEAVARFLNEARNA